MRLATWNVNGLRARLDRVEQWLQERQPTVAVLTETRCPASAIDVAMFGRLGYNIATTPMVVVASQHHIATTEILEYDERILTCRTAGLHLAGLYAPNGTKAYSPAHDHKLTWFDSLTKGLDQANNVDLVMGDLNIARDDADIWAPERYGKRNLFTPQEREAFSSILELGYSDVLRDHHPGPGLYTWWNRAHDSFNRQRGWRLDYILARPPIAELATHAVVDVVERGRVGSSDHAPIWIDLAPK